MSDAPLFHIDGATEGTTQWRAELFQVVNWGGFQGHHAIPLSPTATLLSGASGSGKSTLMDAYLALMMPSDTAFNGASNDATTGRARGADQRNLLSYLLGKTDSRRDPETGVMLDRVLRGENSSTWGAISMTFVDDNRRRFTVLRTYFVPRGAAASANVSMKMAILDSEFDLRELATIAESRFDRRALRGVAPGIQVCGTYLEFAQKLHTRLGIGAGGDGSKALRLLARIQAGQQVRTVDGLYKSMVLERPATFEAADTALAHFADLEKSYEAMVTEDQKSTVLGAVPALMTEHARARAEEATIDTFGVNREGATAFNLWRVRTERELLEAATTANAADRRGARERIATAREHEDGLASRLATIQRQQRENGGDVLEDLGQQRTALEHRREQVALERDAFTERVTVLGAVPESAAEFTAAQDAADTFLAAYTEREQEYEDRINARGRDQYPLESDRRALRDEAISLSGRTGLVPPHLHQARLALAEAAGLNPADLPFVAELIDLASGEERWRTAAEVTLGPVSRILVVDEAHLDAFSRSIDEVELSTRIVFEGVPAGAFTPAESDPEMISGKLVFQDSPYAHWVQDRVRAAHTDALCVESAAELRGSGRRVAPSGQTRDGSRGAHGDNNVRPIIGFSNTARLTQIEAEVAELDARLAALVGEISAERAGLAVLRAHRDAHRLVRDARWSTIDVTAVETALTELAAERERVLADSDVLRSLGDEETRLRVERDAAQRERFLAEDAGAQLATEHERLVDREDELAEAWERVNTAELAPEHAERLNEELAAVGGGTDLAAFDSGVKRLGDRLRAQSTQAREAAAAAESALESAFRIYQDRWPDPNLGTTIESAEGYRDILDTIITTGLHERRQEWTRRLSEWSGQDLVPLGGAFDGAIEAIEERLDPVNEILSTLPFGAGRDRLKIALRRLHGEDVTRFRRELRELSAGSTEALDDAAAQERFGRLRAFMDLLRENGEGRRDDLLDVRRHVEITAVRQTVDGVEVSTYSSLGGKSGGESQELVAFIVGAALRFQLGDESRTRPRFAPVFLDEGFVKSDAEFAGRAVAAWQGLGFQLIVGAPLDKVTALEPYMDRMLSMTKNNASGLSFVAEIASTGGKTEEDAA
ncbi:ATP-binding protein [Mycetocola sp. JXN-3]|uniref:ATP-binding protein n=1 Tax=Mycetocola sp. JXN-3 TaxID=2116510 RepID=UPI00165D16EA|nr:SbcC/MukB-like Walker B domain-containing protein [Mycetocola sp. JXN-3]